MYNHEQISKRVLSVTKGETIYSVAKKLDISKSTISVTLNGTNGWGLHTLIKIAEHYKVSLDWLVFGERNKGLEEEIVRLKKLNSELTDTLKTMRENILISLGEVKEKSCRK